MDTNWTEVNDLNASKEDYGAVSAGADSTSALAVWRLIYGGPPNTRSLDKYRVLEWN